MQHKKYMIFSVGQPLCIALLIFRSRREYQSAVPGGTMF